MYTSRERGRSNASVCNIFIWVILGIEGILSMNIYQARLILKERIEDYLLSFRNSGDFCDIVSGLANDYLSLEHIQNSILIESSNECFFVGDSSAQSACGFGIEYNSDSIYIYR